MRMTDPLIYDIQALLNKEQGDEHILKQICRACKNNEIISNYERNYVRQLTEKYLHITPPAEKKQYPEENISIPNAIFSDIQLKQKIQPSQTTYSQIIQFKSKNTKMFLGIGGIILAIIIIIGVSNIVSSNSNIPLGSSTILIKTDLSTYEKGDVISISGTSSTFGKLNISIQNQDNQLVWSEQVSVKSNGKFSTLTIAGGTGWDKAGTFTIKVENNLDTTSKTFSFRK